MMKTTKLDVYVQAGERNKNKKDLDYIHFAHVVSIDDNLDGLRIKARIEGIDNKLSDGELPYSLPLIPQFMHFVPKVGEAVRVLLSDVNKPYNLRHWVGPIISQPQKISFDPYYYSALNGSEFESTKSEVAPSTLPDADGIYPKPEEIGLLGRDNSDIILSDKNIRIRAGKHLVDNNLKLNRKNPAFLNLGISPDGTESTGMLAGNKIGLMSHNGTTKFNPLMDDEEISRFFNDAHPLPKGDLLVKVIKKLISALATHVHGGSAMPTVKTTEIIELQRIDLEKILSQNIRIN